MSDAKNLRVSFDKQSLGYRHQFYTGMGLGVINPSGAVFISSDRQFKNGKSNFKIAIIVDMWLTGFDVPFLDTAYIDKPIQRHSLIQAILRVNRKYETKEKGLIVDYIGIKKPMNLALFLVPTLLRGNAYRAQLMGRSRYKITYPEFRTFSL